MSLHATDNVEDAFAATKALVWPVDAGQWLRLAVIAFFVGGISASAPPFGGSADGSGAGVEVGALPHVSAVAVLAVVAALLVVGLLFLLVGSVLEFSLVESLAREDVRIREYARDHLGQGLRLFGFRLALFATVGASFAAVVVPFLIGVPAGLLALLVLVPLLLVVAFAVALVNGFTTAFVVPIMVDADCGVLAGWRRLWPVLRAEPKEYLVYLVLSVVLGWVGNTVVGTVLAVVAVVLFVPLLLVGGLTLFAGGLSAASLAVLVGVALLGGLVVLAVGAVARVPVVVYLRYYALLQLGDTSDHDLVAERRAEIRGE